MENEELIRSTGLFTKIDRDKFDQLISQISEITIPAETLFIKEGDKADAFYIVKKGVLQAFTKGHNNEDVILARLEEGSFFGEQALLTTIPGRRNASIRTLSKSVLLKIEHKIFLKLIEYDNIIKEQLEKLGFQQVISKLKAIETEHDLSKYLFDKETTYEVKTFQPDEIILKEGDIPEGVYFLLSGEVNFYKKNGGGIEEIVTTITPNTLFGEAGIITKQNRLATAKARDHAKALFIPAEKFKELYHAKPELKALVDSYHNIYQSPTRGKVTQHIEQFLHMPALITKFHLKDGRELISSKVIEKNIQSIRNIKVKNPTTVAYEDKNCYRELQFLESKLVGITAYGEWSAIQELYSRIFNGGTLSNEEIKIFRENGDISFTKAIEPTTDAEIICNCMYISRGAIKSCIQSGCTTVSEIGDKSGAGSICGACIPTILTMLGHNAWLAMHIVRLKQLTPEVRSYKLFPVNNKPLLKFLPGQHVVIQCQIDGKWVERSYTLTSEPNNTEYYEIAIKMEQGGLFSKWLFENEKSIPFIRTSKPTGHFTFDTAPTTPVVCITAGIGVTPAIGFARAICSHKSKRPLLIFVSARNKEKLAYADDLQHLSEHCHKVTYIKHFTSEMGRVTVEEIMNIANSNRDADFFICGPKGFESMVKKALQQAGIASNRILIEEFTNAASPKA